MYKKLGYDNRPKDYRGCRVGDLSKAPLPFLNDLAYELGNLASKPPKGTKIDKHVPILESKATNARRRAERDAFGLTNDFKLKTQTQREWLEGSAGDPVYYREQLGDDVLGWEEL